MAFHTIKLKKYLDVIEEYAAASTLYPGALIELTSAGKVQNHSTAGGNALPMFALEDELQGKTINDAYAADDKVQCWVAVRGEVVYAILADGQDVHPGDPLESNGAGYLQKHTPDWESSDPGVEAKPNYTNQIVGYALESVDSSADSSGVDFLVTSKRIKVRIL